MQIALTPCFSPPPPSPDVDSQETTALSHTTCFLLIWAGVISGFGGRYRQPVYRNVSLWIGVAVLHVCISICLLPPPNALSKAFHTASEQFNAPNTTYAVWEKYQEKGNPPTPAMDFELRMWLFVIIHVGMLFVTLWEKAVIQGPVHDHLDRQRQKTRQPVPL